MWVLPQFAVRFSAKSGEEVVELLCAGHEDVEHLVPILMRSGYTVFSVSPPEELQFATRIEVSNTGRTPDVSDQESRPE